jgi:hypothetical protein
VHWTDWLRLRRIVPLATITVALALGIADLTGYVPLKNRDGLIVAMLALLALDALVERVSVVDAIERRLANLETPTILRDRSTLTQMTTMAVGAKEIAACGITLATLVPTHHDFWREKLQRGVSLRFMMVDPDKAAWQTWCENQRTPSPGDLTFALNSLVSLMTESYPGKIEVRLSPEILPVSISGVDFGSENGRMNVELVFTRTDLPRRPHVHLTKMASPEWFGFFANIYEDLWSRSRVWTPPARSSSA